MLITFGIIIVFGGDTELGMCLVIIGALLWRSDLDVPTKVKRTDKLEVTKYYGYRKK